MEENIIDLLLDQLEETYLGLRKDLVSAEGHIEDALVEVDLVITNIRQAKARREENKECQK